MININIGIQRMRRRRCISWQSVQYVEKAYISVTLSATLIEEAIKFGNQI